MSTTNRITTSATVRAQRRAISPRDLTLRQGCDVTCQDVRKLRFQSKWCVDTDASLLTRQIRAYSEKEPAGLP